MLLQAGRNADIPSGRRVAKRENTLAKTERGAGGGGIKENEVGRKTHGVFVDASPASGVGVFNRRHLFLTTLLCLSPCSAQRAPKPLQPGVFPFLRFRRPSTLSRNPFPVTRHPSPVTPLSTTLTLPFVRLFSHPFPSPLFAPRSTRFPIADR